MSDFDLEVTGHRGTYRVHFEDDVLPQWRSQGPTIALIDSQVLDLYRDTFSPDLKSIPVVPISASEEQKSLEQMPDLVGRLLNAGARRGSTLLAIGGGITQDITAFLATIMFRGLDWNFVPTTLLAQADSCIGSKSSINAAGVKNIAGTFMPPKSIALDVGVLQTLTRTDMLSGVGEILKVHAIAGPRMFDALAQEYDQLLQDSRVLARTIHASLLIKKSLIEIDEFDAGPRNVMNYGHSFGHAIETATDYAIPHGIAVTIGMDMANYVAAELGLSTRSQFLRMHPVLRRNALPAEGFVLTPEPIVEALRRDKKNSSSHFRMVLPDSDGNIGLVSVDMHAPLQAAVGAYLRDGRLLSS